MTVTLSIAEPQILSEVRQRGEKVGFERVRRAPGRILADGQVVG